MLAGELITDLMQKVNAVHDGLSYEVDILSMEGNDIKVMNITSIVIDEQDKHKLTIFLYPTGRLRENNGK
jgi:hypothetical protein